MKYAVLLALIFVIGCTVPQETSSPFDTPSSAPAHYEGTLRGSRYNIKIWWDGKRCTRREITVTRDCGYCRAENVSHAVLDDRTCRGQFDDIRFRDPTEARRIDTHRFVEDVWFAFYDIVPLSDVEQYRR